MVFLVDQYVDLFIFLFDMNEWPWNKHYYSCSHKVADEIVGTFGVMLSALTCYRQQWHRLLLKTPVFIWPCIFILQKNNWH